MKIAFLKPPVGGILGMEMLTFVEPLGPICVAACLEADGHECKVIDLRIDGQAKGMELCRKFDPDVVGLQCNFTTERNRTIRLAEQVRREMPQAFIVVGGHDASRDPDFFRHEAIDAIASGDGEEVLPPLVDALRRGADLETIRGLEIRSDGGWTFTGPADARPNLDTYPMPARHLIEHYAPHYYINFRKPMALLETARGCPYRCNFCSVWKFHDATFREKSPERVVKELQAIQADAIFITDDIFWLNVRRGEELARQIKAAGIKKYFHIQTRTDIITKFPHLPEMWRECGHLQVFLGIEAITDEGLKALNKKNTTDNNIRAMHILKDLGVKFSQNFIVDPMWDRDDFKRLRDWIEQMNAWITGFTILTPLPGTDLWDHEKHRITTDKWEMFDLVHAVTPTNLPLDEFYEEYSRLWRHVLEVRYRSEGRMQNYWRIATALATGKLSLKNIQRGVGMAKRFCRPQTFLEAHAS